jgi:hypothetical protein
MPAVLVVEQSRVVNPDPYWESGSRSKKMKKVQWKNALYRRRKKGEKNLDPQLSSKKISHYKYYPQFFLLRMGRYEYQRSVIVC